MNTAKVAPGETVAVIGCGGVGMAAINGAAIAGAGRIIAVDTNPVKLQLATKLGATDIVDPKNGDVVQQVRELMKAACTTPSRCSAARKPREQAFQMLKAGGTATIVGMMPFGQRSSCTASTSCASARSRARRWAPTISAWTCPA